MLEAVDADVIASACDGPLDDVGTAVAESESVDLDLGIPKQSHTHGWLSRGKHHVRVWLGR